jgi:MFS superfamily sulfate permease-like transporter
MILAVLFGATILSLLDALPDSILGVMLAIAGQELATTGVSLLAKEQEKLRQQTVVAMVTTVVMVALRKTEIGVLAGWFAYMIYADGLLDFLSWLRRHRRGTDQNRQDVVTDTGRLLSDAEEKDKQEHKV